MLYSSKEIAERILHTKCHECGTEALMTGIALGAMIIANGGTALNPPLNVVEQAKLVRKTFAARSA